MSNCEHLWHVLDEVPDVRQCLGCGEYVCDLDPTDYPTTPVETMPLHPSGHLSRGDVWACRAMRGSLSNLRWDWRCGDCIDHAVERPDELMAWRHNDDSPECVVPLSWLIFRAGRGL